MVASESWLGPQSKLYYRTLLFCIGFSKFLVGLTNGIIGPTMPDLVHDMNTTVEVYSRSLSVKGLALLASLPVSTVIVDVYMQHLELFFAVISVFMAISTAVIPWCSSHIMLAGAFSLQGFCVGNIHVLSMVVAVKLYGETGAPVLAFLSTMTGLGKLAGPVLASPFITKLSAAHRSEFPFDVESKEEGNGTINQHGLFEVHQSETDWSKIVYVPFLLFGILALSAAVGYFLVLRSKNGNNDAMDLKASKNNKKKILFSCGLGWKILMCVALVIMYTTLMTAINGMEYYLYSVAVFSRLHFSKSEAVFLVAGYNICQTLGTLLSAVILNFVSIKIFTNVSAILAAVTGIFLVIFGLSSHLALWILILIFIYLLAPLYAAGYAYADRFIEITGKIAAMMEFGMGCGFMIAAWLIAEIFDSHGSQAVLITFTSNASVCCFVVVAMLVIGTYHGDKYETMHVDDYENIPIMNSSDEE